MCVFVNPVKDVKDTKVFWHLLPNGRHLQGYQNSVFGNGGRQAIGGRRALRGGDMLPSTYPSIGIPVHGGDGGQMMVLPVPCVPGTIGPHSFHDVSRFPSILKDMQMALYTYALRGTRGGGLLSYGAAKGMQVFNYGAWTLAVGHVEQVTRPELLRAMAMVPDRKRPVLTDDVMRVMMAFPAIPTYNNWSLIYAFADSADLNGEMTPFMYDYQPLNPDRVFMPAIDSHTGLPPVPGQPVDVDHTLIFGVPNSVDGAEVDYTDPALEYSPFRNMLPDKVIGVRATGTVHNGDWSGATMNILKGPGATISRSFSPMTWTARPAIEG